MRTKLPIGIAVKPWATGAVMTIFLLNGILGAAMGQSPNDISAGLDKRANKLIPLEFDWQVVTDTTNVGQSQANRDELSKQYGDVYRQSLQSQGIVGPKADEMVKSHIDSLYAAMGPSSIHFNTVWEFRNDGVEVNVKGDSQTSPDCITRNAVYFSQGYGLGNCPYAKDAKTNATIGRPTSVEVWKTDGDAARYRAPIGAAVSMTPELLAMLIGKNPLAMYGATWKLTSTTPKTFVFQATVTKGPNAPFAITMTLDRDHDNMPVKILFDRSKELGALGALWKETYEVTGFEQYNGVWMASAATTTYDRPNFTNNTRHWVLQGTSRTDQLVLNMPKGMDLADYRLLGSNLTMPQLAEATKLRGYDILQYEWEKVGEKLPTETQLAQMRDQLHPGEGTPDPQKGAMLGGGAMVVAGMCLFGFTKKKDSKRS